MVRRLTNNLSKFIQLGKVFFPLRHLRNFPPHFTLRDPGVEGISKVFRNGNEVAVIVFKLINQSDLVQKLGNKGTEKLFHLLKCTFSTEIKKIVPNEEIILLDYHYDSGFTFYIEVKEDDDKNGVNEIDLYMTKLFSAIQKRIKMELPGIGVQFDHGFMFIDKKHPVLPEAILHARLQALTMAQKRVQSEYNEMLYEMSRIISKKNISIFGQPIIDMKTKKIQAWEMLTRGPKGTNLEMPLRLFSVARQTGHLYDLELIVLERVLEKMKETGCKQEIFVNCTPLTLGNNRLVEDIKNLLKKFPIINPNNIIIEMTEQDTVDDKKKLLENMRELRQFGFRIALDDTGAGYSSLHTIGEILPEIIKIDQSVIQNIHENSVNQSMLKGILLIANEVGSRVVAEGIEMEEEAIVLAEHKVDYAQGYYYARPAMFNQHLLLSI